MKFNFKKIASIMATTVMLGSTVAFAAAAYPAPFVNNGVADAAVVVGANAAAADTVAATNLKANLDKSVIANSGTLSGTGDQAKIEKSSSKFTYGNGVTNFESSLDDKDLPTLLAEGTYMDSDNNEFDYKQSLDLANLTLGLFDNDEYKRDTPTVGFDITEGTFIMNATLDFVDDPAYINLETTDLPILGKMYYVLDMNSANDTLTLLDSAESTTMSEGETKTLTIDGKAYEVKVDYVSDTKVKFVINGESTNNLASSGTQRLADGAYVGVKDIMYSAKDTGTSKVEFSIGAGKLVIEHGEEVKLNDDSISNLKGYFANGSTTTKLDKVILNWAAESDSWITPDSQIEMPGFKAVKMSFTGMTYPKEQSIIVQADGDDNIVLSNFPLANGVTETISLVYSNGANFTIAGKDSNNKLAVSAAANGTLTFTKNVDDYFVVTYINGEDAESNLVRATNWDDTDSPDNVVDFEYLTSSGWKALDSDVNRSDEVTVGDAIFTVGTVSAEGSAATVVVTAGASTSFNKIVSSEGLTIALPYHNSTAVNQSTGKNCSTLTFNVGELSKFVIANVTTANATCYASTYVINATEETKDDAIMGGNTFNITVGLDTDSQVYITAIGGDETAYEIGDTNVYRSFVKSALATEILDDQSGDHEKATLIYHGGESYGNVFVTAPTVTTGAAGSIVVVKDTEVASVKDKNLVVVGGSCINTVAAQILGSSTPLCGAAFADKTGAGVGKFLIQVAASPVNSQKVAMLVAGYDAADTTTAVAKVNEGKESTSVGKVVYPLASA